MELNRDDYKYAYIATATTTQVYTGGCRLIRIVVNTTAAGTINIIDGTAGSTTNVGLLKASVAEGTYYYGIKLTTGLRVITGGASDITVVYTPN
jgi:hypothetical protein